MDGRREASAAPAGAQALAELGRAGPTRAAKAAEQGALPEDQVLLGPVYPPSLARTCGLGWTARWDRGCAEGRAVRRRKVARASAVGRWEPGGPER
jgi:hypothetical protein